MRAIAFILLAIASATLPAQATQQDLETRFLNKPLYLRGLWDSNHLKFDAAGQLTSRSGTTSPMLSGIQINGLKLDSKSLSISGHRVAVVYKDGVPTGFPLGDKISIEIANSGDIEPALQALFTSNLADLASAAPDYWKPLLVAGPSSSIVPDGGHVVDPANPRGVYKIGGGVSPPIAAFTPEPKYSDQARALQLQGIVLVGLVIDAAGMPQRLRILRPLGAGLDEAALEAVKQYRFHPALKDGNPVPVSMNVAVNFQLP